MRFKEKAIPRLLTALLLLSLGGTTLLFSQHFDTPYQQFTDQAQSFLRGKLHVENSGSHDMVELNGKYYWPNGPFPSVLLLPFQLVFGSWFDQSVMQFVLAAIMMVMLYKMARLKHFDKVSSLFLSVGFISGTFIISLIINPKSWLFAQVVCLFFLTLILYEWETHRRAWLLGIYAGALFGTRPTSAIITLLMLAYFARNVYLRRTGALVSLGLFIAPLALTLVGLLWFNYARFGDILDNGYVTNNIGPTSDPLRSIGVFSLAHIPMNFYWYFLASYEDVTGSSASLVFPYITYSDWGLSIFLTSAFFAYSLRSFFHRSAYVRGLWAVVLITLLILLMYFNTGWRTFGPRYAADFMPIIFVLTLYGLQKKSLTLGQRALMVAVCLTNVYLLYTTPLD